MTTDQTTQPSLGRILLAAVSITAFSSAVLPLEASLTNVANHGSTGSRSHTVVKGDTLLKLSRHYGVAVEAIRLANAIEGDLIRLGETLTIPGTSGFSGTPGEQARKTFHVVVKGDYLVKIGRRYGVTSKELQQWNGLRSSVIHPGQKLRVVAPENEGRDAPAESPVDRAGGAPPQDESGRIAPPPVPRPIFPTPQFGGGDSEMGGEEKADDAPDQSFEETPALRGKGREYLSTLPPADRLRLQVFLDSEGFAPGKVDGAIGEFTEKAAKRWILASGYVEHHDPMGALVAKARAQVENPYGIYLVSPEDQKRVGRVAASIPDKAKQTYLPYVSLAEAVAERFHTDERMLARLNPGIDMRGIGVGTTLTVPQVRDPFDLGADVPKLPSGSSSNRIVIVWPENILEVRDAKDVLVASFPVTLGDSGKYVRSGTWTVGSFVPFPTFRWDASVLKSGVKSENYHLLPAGPNNLVGVLWMGLKKPDGTISSVGIHGTDNPETIGRAESSGCIRLANWDVVRLGRLVSVNSPVNWSRF